MNTSRPTPEIRLTNSQLRPSSCKLSRSPSAGSHGHEMWTLAPCWIADHSSTATPTWTAGIRLNTRGGCPAETRRQRNERAEQGQADEDGEENR